MQRNRFVALLCLPALLAAAGCVSWHAPVLPPSGLLFTNYKAPITTDFDRTAVVTKKGSVSTQFIRDIIFTGQGIAWDEATLQGAARAGNIQHIHYADYEVLSVLGVYAKFTTTVYGD
jgi:hypothetical protein